MASSTSFTILIGALTILGLWLLQQIRRRMLKWLSNRRVMRENGCKDPPRYPHIDPLFGFDLFLEYKRANENRSFLDMNKRQFDTCGKTFRGLFLGNPIIKTIDPEVSKCVHATHFDKFGVEPIRYDPKNILWGDGISMMDGERWSTRRSLIKPTFNVAHISNLDNRSLAHNVDRLMKLIPKDGSTVDLMPLFKRLSLDTSSEFIMGKSLDALSSDSDAYKEFTDAFFYAQRGTAIRLMLRKFAFLHRDQKWWSCVDLVNNTLDAHIEAAVNRLKSSQQSQLGDGHLRLVDEMAKVCKDRATLRYQLQNIFAPAHDGPAVILSNAFFFLSRNPEKYEKLRNEILPTKDEPVSYDLLNSYQYLKKVYRETNRLTPVSTMNQRQCIESTVLPCGGGSDGKSPLLVRKGDIVEINYRCMMRDEDFWGKDASEFRPERWEDLRPTWEFTPFGGGPRVCPALRLVFAEVAYTMVEIVRRFKHIESRDEKPWQEDMRTTFQNKNGTKVGMIPE